MPTTPPVDGNNNTTTTLSETFKLVGHSRFVRSNPKTERFSILNIHHVEFWCSNSTSTSRRFSQGLDMPLSSHSDLSTGSLSHASYLLRSSNLRFLFSAPYMPFLFSGNLTPIATIPSFNVDNCHCFAATHGLGVQVVVVEVEDGQKAFQGSVKNGAWSTFEPVELGRGESTGKRELLYNSVFSRMTI